jgi:hypothetical protein
MVATLHHIESYRLCSQNKTTHRTWHKAEMTLRSATLVCSVFPRGRNLTKYKGTKCERDAISTLLLALQNRFVCEVNILKVQ